MDDPDFRPHSPLQTPDKHGESASLDDLIGATVSRSTCIPSAAPGFPGLFAAALTLCLAGCAEHQGTSVVDLPVPATEGSAQPHLAAGPGDSVVMSWLQPREEESVLRYAVYDDGAWSPPVDVASGSDWFVNWADFPSVVPMSKSLWGAHWLRKTPGNRYSYDVVLSQSADGGRSWSEAVVPHDDGTATEHGFVSLFPSGGGVGAVWLDGRETGGHGNHGAGGGMTLRSAVLAEGNRVVEPNLMDGLVCDCCQTDVATTPSGPVAVYRDRRADEIRDVYVSRRQGDAWTEGVAVANDEWRINGCPVNGPSISAGHGLVTVAWFTAAGDRPKVRAAFSTDDGGTFGEAIDVDLSEPLGRVATLILDPESALVAWLSAPRDGKSTLVASRVDATGRVGPAVPVADLDSGRTSGFPQMVAHNDGVVFAWTHVENETTSVRAAVAPVALFDDR